MRTIKHLSLTFNLPFRFAAFAIRVPGQLRAATFFVFGPITIGLTWEDASSTRPRDYALAFAVPQPRKLERFRRHRE